MEDNTMDQASTAPQEQASVDEDTPSPGGGSNPFDSQEAATKSENAEVQDKSKTPVNDQTKSKMEENKSSEGLQPSQTPKDAEDSLKDQVENAQEEQTTAAEQTLSPGGENKLTETEQPCKTLQDAENSQKGQNKPEPLPEEQSTADEQTPFQVDVDNQTSTDQPSKTPEDAKDSQKDHADTVSEGQTIVGEQKLSIGEEKQSDKEESSKRQEDVWDAAKDQVNTETAKEEHTDVVGLPQSPSEESKQLDKEELSKTPEVVEVTKKDQVSTETSQEEHTDVDGQPQSPPKESKQSDTEEPSEKPKAVKGLEKDKETALAAQTTGDTQVPPPGEESKPLVTGKPSETPENVTGRILVVTAVVGVLFAIILRSFFENMLEVDTPDKPSDRCDPHKGDCRQFLSQSIHKLSEKYKDQESNSWRTLHAAAFSHVSQQSKPVRPIVILVYWVNSSNHQILFDISNVYSSVLSGSKSDGNIVIQGTEFVDQESESVQKHIAGELERGFKDGKKVAIIHDFDNLPSCSVLTFHNYCNNEDAPYTDVAIILTMTGNPKMEPGQKPKVLEESVSTIFHKKWSDCPEDLPPGKIDAILSRVANNVVLLR